MNIHKNDKRENGQILVLLAISLVVVMIVAALAVDGGMIYSQRRFAQNAADAASLAGGGKVLETLHNGGDALDLNCPSYATVVYNPDTQSFTTSNLVTDAYFEARNNAINSNNITDLPFLGYEINGVIDPNDNSRIDQKNGVVINCVDTIDYDLHFDVEVRITSEISTSFAQLIFPGPIETTNVAITSSVPSTDLGYGNGIVSLSDQCQNNTDGMEFSGTNEVSIYGGGVHSNSCLTGGGDVEVIAEDGSISLSYSDAVINGGALFDPSPTGSAPAVPITVLDPVTCPSTKNTIADPKNNVVTKGPGSYTGLKMTGGDLTLSSGTFCMYGDVEVTGGTLTGEEVTIIMVEGDIKINGNATVQLIAPYSDLDDPFFGMLIYMPPSNSGLIALVGNEESLYSGTIYAPSGSVELGGVSTADTPADQCKLVLDDSGNPIPDPDNPGEFLCEAVTFSTQIIAWYVKVVGTAQMDILFDDSTNARTPTSLYLKE